VYATLIDAGCLTLLWRLTRREGTGLFDLAGFRRSRLGRDVLLGLALIPASLVFIFGGNRADSIEQRRHRPRVAAIALESIAGSFALNAAHRSVYVEAPDEVEPIYLEGSLESACGGWLDFLPRSLHA
jgi:hypothetical protein